MMQDGAPSQTGKEKREPGADEDAVFQSLLAKLFHTAAHLPLKTVQ